MTIIEMAVTAGLVSVLGLIIYSFLNAGTILGAKNTAVNTAHQQARVAMLEMLQHLHQAVSLPALTNTSGTPYLAPLPAAAEGISFQQWSMGPFKIIEDTALLPSDLPVAGLSQDFVKIALPSAATQRPAVGQRLIVPTHQIEGDITAVTGTFDNLTITLGNIAGPAPAPTKLPVRIFGTASTAGDLICYMTDRCSYKVVVVAAGPPVEYKLQWTKQGTTRDIVNDVTNARPFSIPTTPAGALYYRSVAAIDLSTSDPQYSQRGYKSANILLNGQVPSKTRLTTYQ